MYIFYIESSFINEITTTQADKYLKIKMSKVLARLYKINRTSFKSILEVKKELRNIEEKIYDDDTVFDYTIKPEFNIDETDYSLFITGIASVRLIYVKS